MLPYGYHNSEINHITREEQRNAREAIRQAKLVRQHAIDEAAGTEPDNHAPRSGWWRRLIGSTPRAYVRHLRAHSH
jgi:hypothetical protein